MQEAARQGQMQRKRCEQTLTGRVKIATGGRKRRGGIFVPRDHHGIAAHDRFLVAPQLGGLVVAGGSDDIVGSRAHRLRATPTLAAIRGSCASRHGVGACLLPIQTTISMSRLRGAERRERCGRQCGTGTPVVESLARARVRAAFRNGGKSHPEIAAPLSARAKLWWGGIRGSKLFQNRASM
jgi:hypothetical protein